MGFEKRIPPFSGFNTKIHLVYHRFCLSRFVPSPQKRDKQGLPVFSKIFMFLDSSNVHNFFKKAGKSGNKYFDIFVIPPTLVKVQRQTIPRFDS